MIHVILTCVAVVLGFLAASSGTVGFWTGVFVGAVMITSGKKWLLHAVGELRKEQAAKDASEMLRQAALAKRVQALEAEKAAAAVATQKVEAPLPPLPPQSIETTQPLPPAVVKLRKQMDTAPAAPAKPVIHWPELDEVPSFMEAPMFAMPPN